ncbi:hypothetical protein [Puniceicoccus vermicola]|uniref:Uncharacterized protein n=1 Tax=Puniceicoccus vermicola TaxID=388746 RepID=A0A7X1AX19_9BACT|nr:hypothetical protein [Puniceicoccus vermicola]MBC2601469.1 hypothetical protein [Puniceicoccus vermicola]
MKHIEKIIFLVVLIVVAGLSAWVFMGDAKAPNASQDIPPAGGSFPLEEYTGIPPLPQVNWPEPMPQDSEGKWLYRVFTPPVLYIVDGAFVPVRPVDPVPDEPEPEPEPFGVALTDITRNMYRLQLDAIYETKLNDVDSAVLSFENVYATQTERPTVTLKKGETDEHFQFRVDDIERKEKRIGGGLEREHVATITDLKTGKTVLLSDRDTLYEEGVTLTFESTVSPGQTVTLKSVGETFEMNDATYTLSEINLDNSSVQLVKESETLDVPEVKTLTPETVEPVTETPSPQATQPNTESGSSDFDQLFN